MKARTYVLIICLALVGLAGTALAKDAPVASLWAASPVRVDGSAADWIGQPVTLFKEAGMEYAFRNDADNLYAICVFKDRKGLSSLEQTGLRVYFAVDGKKKKELGVRFFRKSVSADELIADLEQRGETLTDQRKTELRSRPSYTIYAAEVINKKKLTAPVDPAVKTLPPASRFGPEGQALVYEVRIPLNRTNQPGGIGAAPGEAIKLAFEWGGTTPEMRQAQMTQRAQSAGRSAQAATEMAVSGSDDYEDSGGYYGGEGGGPMRGPRQFSFWVDVALAAGK